MTVSTLYIRNLKLVGPGFFWMMWITNVCFSAIALFTSSGIIQLLSLVLFLGSIVALSFSIINRKKTREIFPTIEIVVYVLNVVVLIFLFVFISNEAVDEIYVFFESVRLIVGGMLLGGVTSTMLLGHWYLVQPGLTRKPISRLCIACMWILALNILFWFLPNSMLSVLNGSVSDGWGGTLGYMWVGSCVTTGALIFAAYKALQEKSYSAVMATTGLLYLAILVANGVELIPRAIFS